MPATFKFPAIIVVILALPAAMAPAALAREAAPTGAVYGRVSDARTGLGLEGCRVRLLPADTSVRTDSAGRFRLAGLVPGTHRAVFIRSGYQVAENSNIVVGPGRGEEVSIRLVPNAGDTVIELADSRARGRVARSPMNDHSGSIRYGRNDVLRAPGVLLDISLFAQTLPGVSRSNDQATDLAVRGGGPDENGYLIDGIPIFNINHFENNSRDGGGIGNINTYFLDGVDFHTGAYSARYPDRLSSVMDISFKRGNPDQYSGSGIFDMAGFGGLVEGPVPGAGGRTTFGATTRVSSLSTLDRLGVIDFGGVPRYANAHLKLNHLAGPWDLSFNALGGVDEYDSRWTDPALTRLSPLDSARYRTGREERMHTDNLFAGLRATRNAETGRLSGYAALNTRTYRYEEARDHRLAENGGPLSPAGLRTGFSESSGGMRLLWGLDADRRLGHAWTLRAGALHEYDRPEIAKESDFRFTREGAGDSTGGTREERSTSYYGAGAYGEVEYDAGAWEVIGGARLLYDEYTRGLFLGPRLAVTRRIGSHAVKGAVGLHTQSQAEAAFARGRAPGEGALPFNVQSLVGWDAALPAGFFTRVEVYDKQTFRLLRFRADGAPRDTGRSVSRGIEIYVRKSLRDRLWGSASYTFAWNRDEVEGRYVSNAFSVPHSFSSSLGYDFGRRFSASVRLGLGSGSPFTPIAGGGSPGTGIPGRRYSEATDPYFRLDTRVEYRHAFSKATLGAFLEITNLTDNENLFTEEEFFLNEGWGFLPVGGVTVSF